MKAISVTVCELSDDADGFERDWEQLVAHVEAAKSDLVLLPEMPFCPWFAWRPDFDLSVWQDAVVVHDRWLERLVELQPAIVLGTSPVNRGDQRLNEGFCWTKTNGYQVAHHKYYLPNEPGFWEANWYGRGDGSFTPTRCGEASVGFEVCTDLWAFERARAYGKAGAHLIVTPRATPKTSLEKWLVGGRATAITAGAFSLSSNHVATAADPVHLGGQGWIVGPEGDVLGVTSREQPFVTAQLDLNIADQAKHTYPRYAI
jgi:N-carbamoylputrescine amidase